MTARGRSSLATDAQGGTMSVVTGDARRARGRDRRRSRRPDGGRGPGRPGYSVDVYDAMPSVGRKFLMAGRGGLNLTHSSRPEPFLARYGDRAAQVAPWLARMDAAALRDWAHGLGVRTFVRIGPRGNEGRAAAAPGWRACAAGLRFHMRHRWLGWPEDAAGGAADLRFDTPEGERRASADAVVLALGGGSWARLVRMAPGRRGLRAWRCRGAVAAGQLRVRRGLVGTFPRALRGPAGQAGVHALRR